MKNQIGGANYQTRGNKIWINIIAPEDFTPHAQEEIARLRILNPKKKIYVEIVPSFANAEVREGSNETGFEWLIKQGFEVTIIRDVGLVALDKALSTYGEDIKRSFLFQEYVQMIASCYFPMHPDYEQNRARGITVCDRWLNDFADFVEDMMKVPGASATERRRWKAELFELSALMKHRLARTPVVSRTYLSS